MSNPFGRTPVTGALPPGCVPYGTPVFPPWRSGLNHTTLEPIEKRNANDVEGLWQSCRIWAAIKKIRNHNAAMTRPNYQKVHLAPRRPSEDPKMG